MALVKLNARSATALDATVLTGNLPAISGASLTGIASTNDFEYIGNLDKGTLIFVGIGTESSSAAKNGAGILNITITQR